MLRQWDMITTGRTVLTRLVIRSLSFEPLLACVSFVGARMENLLLVQLSNAMAKLGTSLNNSCGVEEQMDEPFLRRQNPGTLPISMHRIRSGLRGSYVLALVVIASSVQINLYAQRAAKLSPGLMEVVNGPLLELKDDDSPLLKLKKERFNAALKEAAARFRLYDRGLTRLPELIEVGERLFAAEVDLND